MPNSFMQEFGPLLTGTQSMTYQLLDVLTDDDLRFTPGGTAMTLGALCREMGEVEHSYLQSFKTFKQDFNYRNTEPSIETSVEKLRAWYKALDAELNATLEAMSEEDLKKMIDRGGFSLAVSAQPHVYLQALLIFFGKASIYLRVMGKPLPQQWQDWVW